MSVDRLMIAIVEQSRRIATPTVVPLNGRCNNFDLLRLLLSLSVVLLHSYALSLNPALKVLAKAANLSLNDISFDTSSLAVKAFFVVSGYLIFKSYDESASALSFFRNRFLRIYPAYAAVIVITGAALALLTPLSLGEYFCGPFCRYILANLTFCTTVYPELPGVFANNPGMKLVNGALWTIKVEVMFYCVVPLLHWGLKRFSLFHFAAVLYICSIVYKTLCLMTGHHQLANQLPGQMSFFISGAMLHYANAVFVKYSRVLLLPCLLVFGVEHTLGVEMFHPFALAVLVLYFAFSLPSLFPFRPSWDLSYGIYIVHFPIIQAFVSIGLLVNHPYLSLGIVLTTVIAVACVSWQLIEKPIQRWKVAKPLSHDS